jgi:putative oxidoreductase
MTHAQWTMPQHHHAATPLAERVAGGGVFWLLGRVMVGGLFLSSGLQKFMSLDQFAASLVKNGISDSFAPVLAPVAAGAETIGGFCIMVGLATGWAALLMIVFTIIAAFVSHRFWEFQGDMAKIQQAHFLKNMMIVGGFWLLYVAGGGPYSIDRWRRERN